MTSDRAREIATLLITKRFLHRKELRDMFLDDNLMESVSERLAGVGLSLVTNVYSNYVSLKPIANAEENAFRIDENRWSASSNHMEKGALALLAIIWAKMILPKRQMQIERKTTDDAGQEQLWANAKKIPRSDSIIELQEKALKADFQKQLGGSTWFGRYLSELARNDFIVRKGGKILEGPLLDTAIDYSVLSARIINGALADVLRLQKTNDSDTPDKNGEAES